MVVPSANLQDYDWGEPLSRAGRGIMENILYIQDFPLGKDVTPDDDTEDDEDDGSFLAELTFVAKALGLPATILRQLEKYDYGLARGVRLVSSIGQPLHGDDIAHTGLGRLQSAVRSLDLTLGDATVDYLTSSIGYTSPQFVHNLLRACLGRDFATISGKATEKAKAAEDDRKALRIIFPSDSTVRESVIGYEGGGTNWFRRVHFTRDNFPRACLYDYISRRPEVLSHCKTIVVRSREDPKLGYAYLGSANCSVAAWSTGPVNKKGIQTLDCTNYECGVLVPLSMVEHVLPYEQKVWRRNAAPWYTDEPHSTT